MPTIADDVRELIAEQLDIDSDEVKDASNLVDDLNSDSLDLIELVIALEERFHIAISDDDAQGLVTVGDVIGYVGKKCGK